MARKKTSKPKTYILDVDVDLTPEEWKTRAMELGQILDERAEIKVELAKAGTAAREAQAKYKPRIEELRQIMRTEKEPKPLEVYDVMHYDQARVDTLRVDTAEVVISRDMTEEERQTQLPGTD